MLCLLILRRQVWGRQSNDRTIDKIYNAIGSINWKGFLFYVMIYKVTMKKSFRWRKDNGYVVFLRRFFIKIEFEA